jgi:hypothetical protein
LGELQEPASPVVTIGPFALDVRTLTDDEVDALYFAAGFERAHRERARKARARAVESGEVIPLEAHRKRSP